MKDIAWSKILSVGVAEIDEDHRKLVHTFNVLQHAVRDGEAPEYVAAILEEEQEVTGEALRGLLG